jgi:peptidoglycan lytic transglycosylase
MGALLWVVMFLGLSAVAAFGAERASLPRVDDGSKPLQQLVSGIQLAQRLPFEPNKIEPIDPKTAFLEGYQAYRSHDLIGAIGRMQLAAAQLPDLADYALFYLASAERDDGDSQAAADDFRRLTLSYPQSVWCDDAGLEYARLELKLGHPDYAIAAANRVVVSTTVDRGVEQNARLTMARALLATNSWRAAYDQAQLIRQKFPTGSADGPARNLAYAILAAHPQIISVPLEYHRTEAALLLREGQDKAALAQIQMALALKPPRSIQAELTWFSAEASRGTADRMKAQLQRYLELAPLGVEAARALSRLAHLYWHENDTDTARLYFRRIPRDFPHDELASEAMFEIGRTYEEDGNLQAARLAYLDLVRRYPGTQTAIDARFRASFILYMLGRYRQAAAEFSDSRAHAAISSARDMFAYWQARALEKNGEKAAAQGLLETLAVSTGSNYYPALAAMRIKQTARILPAAFAPDLTAGIVPMASGPLQFHLTRVAALRSLGLRKLEAPELRAAEGYIGGNRTLQRFVLAELQSADAWFDAIGMAMRMEARGEISPAAAERIRYPRGFWDLVAAAADRNQLDPFLVTALIRQESLFNPQAHSISDARGLMQLLPTTAGRYAGAAGIIASPLDLYDPTISIQLGTVYLRALMGMFGGDIFKVVAAYNAGEHSVSQWNARYPGDDDQWVENIGFHETRDYVKKVIGGMREYQQLYGSPSALSTSIRVR